MQEGKCAACNYVVCVRKGWVKCTNTVSFIKQDLTRVDKSNTGNQTKEKINPDVPTFYYESNNSVKSLFKNSETAYTYSQLELIIGPWLNFRKI